jgi:hypothetical protein
MHISVLGAVCGRHDHELYVDMCRHFHAALMSLPSRYVGAMPGRLIAAVRKAGCRDPLILLDEVDKMGHDHRCGFKQQCGSLGVWGVVCRGLCVEVRGSVRGRSLDQLYSCFRGLSACFEHSDLVGRSGQNGT